jgi:NAD(P)-dependent dehydrogenase (short-subunit alcohol dehydrogenase family)
VIAKADSAFGNLHALGNCAGLTDRGTILDTSPALFDRMFAVNTRAPFFLMQGAAKIMRHEGTPGAMVNVVSMSGHGGQSFLCPYSASKGALITLTRNVAYSLMRDHIRVNALNIGWMNTPGEASIQKSHHNAEDDWLEKAMQQQPFGRLLEPQEVARAVAFLCSDESGLMTGSIIDFDQSVLGSYEETPQPAARLTD